MLSKAIFMPPKAQFRGTTPAQKQKCTRHRSSNLGGMRRRRRDGAGLHLHDLWQHARPKGCKMEGQLKESTATGRFTAISAMAAERLRLERRAVLLSEVLGAFAEATIEYDQLLGVVAQKLSESLGDLCTVLLLSEDGRTLTAAATYDQDPEVRALAHTRFGSEPFPVLPVHRKVLETGEPYFTPRVHPERVREITTATRASFTEQIGVHSSFV